MLVTQEGLAYFTHKVGQMEEVILENWRLTEITTIESALRFGVKRIEGLTPG